MIFQSKFVLGARVKISYYSGFGTIVGIRFTKDHIYYDIDRDIGGPTVRDVGSGSVEPK